MQCLDIDDHDVDVDYDDDDPDGNAVDKQFRQAVGRLKPNA